MKRVLITGGTGFVGACLARHLQAGGDEVHLLVRSSSDLWRLAGAPDLHLHQADLRNAEAVRQAVRSIRPEQIFHLAVFGAYPHQTDLRQIVDGNILATVNLLEACLETGFEAFVNTGASSEYGFKDHAPSERDLLEPNSYYAVTKASATLLCQYAARRHQLCIPTLRLYSVYGRYEEPTRLIPTLIVRGLKGELPPLVRPDTARDFVYIDDVIDAYLRAASKRLEDPGAVYNVGTGAQTTLAQAVEVIRSTFGIEREPDWGSMGDRIWDTSVWVADSARIQRELGWTPRHSFEQGFRATVDWFRAHPDLLRLYQQKLAVSR